MRQLFLLLLLLNLMLFGWQHLKETHQSPEKHTVTLPSTEAVKTLVLLSETTKKHAPKTGSRQPAGASRIALPEPVSDTRDRDARRAGVCYTVGPFERRESAERAAKMLGRSGIRGNLRGDVVNEGSGYWIFLPASDSRDEARNTLRELRGLGVTDSAIVALGGNRFVVSLGIFSRKASLDKRYAELSSLGFAPEVKRRYKARSSFWIDFAGKEKQLLPDLVREDLARIFPDVRQQRVYLPLGCLWGRD